MATQGLQCLWVLVSLNQESASRDKIFCPWIPKGSPAIVLCVLLLPDFPLLGLQPNISKVTLSWFSPQVTKIHNEPSSCIRKQASLWLLGSAEIWSSYSSLKLEKPISLIQVVMLCSLSLMLSQPIPPTHPRYTANPWWFQFEGLGLHFTSFLLLLGAYRCAWSGMGVCHFACLRGQIYFQTFYLRMVLDLHRVAKVVRRVPGYFFPMFPYC